MNLYLNEKCITVGCKFKPSLPNADCVLLSTVACSQILI